MVRIGTKLRAKHKKLKIFRKNYLFLVSFFILSVDIFAIKAYNMTYEVEQNPIKVKLNGGLWLICGFARVKKRERGGFSVRACWHI